ncbi:MAG: TlpA family protein disulfide reductase [Thiotrichales bacterium]|nr:TlpA family protein disulfide reductase [Thiotrichales bacterium]
MTLSRFKHVSLTLLFTAFLSAPSISFAKDVATPTAKPLTYEDRALWLSLPQTEIEAGDETYLITELKSTQNPTRLYLWIGEPANTNDGDALTIKGLTNSGTVWYLDTPEALFMDRTRIAMRRLDGQFLKNLMLHATQQFKEIVVITADVASVPTLRGLHLWQQTADKTQRNQLKNVILLYPSLFVNAPAAGEKPEFFPISYQTALPITILQPAVGTQANTIGLSAKALKMGGSLVQTIQVPIATDGYYKYQDIEIMAKDAAQRIQSSTQQQIEHVQQIGYQVAKLSPIETPIPKSKIVSGMVALNPPMPMPNIQLESLDGEVIDVLKAYKGKALLINFWATWCPHCVEEIPSMNRALEQLDDDKFAMVSISYKDTRALLEAFVKEVKVDFPILLDRDGKVSEQWNIFAFPSSFLVDANGLIRYSLNAGSIWDSPEMLDYQREVMAIPYAPK